MNKNSAFTIVELVVVIAVIGILAAITIVSYRGIQNNAYDSAVKADLRNAYAKIEVQASRTGKNEKWSADLQSAGIKVTKDAYKLDDAFNFAYCPPYPFPNSKDFAVVGSSKSGKIFAFSGLKGAHEYTGTHTMNHYATVCVHLTDKNNEFSGDYTAEANTSPPRLYITTPAYGRDRTGEKWSSWVNS